MDTQSAPELEAELNELTPDVSSLVFDCSGLEYISSAGLRQLVAAHKKMNGALTLRHVSDEIMGVIRMTGLDEGFFEDVRVFGRTIPCIAPGGPELIRELL